MKSYLRFLFLSAMVPSFLMPGSGAVYAATGSGTLGGALSVDPTGSARYTIPIEVPPGTAGMQPSLSLSYSQHGGNGMLGQGGSLQGLSSISRCPKTKAQDGEHGSVDYDPDDRFCLDGQRLVAVSGRYGASGTEYRTEIDRFVKVISRGTADGGPRHWKVWTKSGRKMEYGRTASSRVEATGRSAVRQWKLNRVEDTAGNYMTVSYTEDTAGGFAYPRRIDYGGHRRGDVIQAPYASVRFAYKARHDDLVRMQGGSRVRVDRRLTRIRTYVGKTLVSNYRLAYSSAGPPEPSRLVGIRRCDGAGDCLPGVRLTWNGLGAGRVASAGKVERVAGSRDSHVVSGDFDGDGRVSFVAATPPPGYRGYSPLVADYDGDGNAEIGWTLASEQGLSFLRGGIPKTVKTGDFSGYEAQAGDFDGDGRMDLVWTKAYPGGLLAETALSEGQSLATATTTQAGSAPSSASDTAAVTGFGSDAGRLAPSSSGHAGVETRVGDFNGDGLADLAWSQADDGGIRAYVSLGTGTGTFEPAVHTRVKSTGNHTGYKPYILDMNGDRLSDLVWTKATNGGLYVLSVLGEGDGTFAPAQGDRLLRGGGRSDHETLVGDFNGDGIPDLAWAQKSDTRRDVYISLGDGDGLFHGARLSAIKSLRDEPRKDYRNLSIKQTRSPIAGDFNGDGITDIAWRSWVGHRQAGGTTNYWAVHHAAGVAPEGYGQVSTIASGNGTTFTLEYASLSDPDAGVYKKADKADSCRRPCRDVPAPVHVVEQVTRDHGDGLTERVAYRYGGAKVDLEGRGPKGFRWIESKDMRTGIISRTVYRQDFPYVGQVESSHRYLGSSPRIHLDTESNVWSSRSLNGGSTQFPYISSSTAAAYEPEDGPGNRAVTTVTNASSYDDYGNPTAITVTTVGAGGTYRKVTTNTYANTTSDWRLGRLTCATVRSEAPGETAVTRTSGFAYDATTGRRVKAVVEPGSGAIPGCVSTLSASVLPDISLTTTYQYDQYGNRRQATTRGDGVAPRSSTTVWGERARCGSVTANGRFPVSVSNALGHTVENWYSALYGKVVKRRDANGLESRWEYDGFGRPIRTVHADGRQTITQYRDCTDAGLSCPPRAVRAVLTDRTGSASVVRYLDRRGRVVRTETEGFDGTAIYQDTAYDAAGRAVRRSRAYYAGETARWRRYAYDELGRMKRETLPNGSVTETDYDGLEGGWVRERVHVRTSAGATPRTTTREYDALGRTVRTTDPVGNRTSFGYTASGKRKTVTAANGSVTTRTFDLRGRLLSETDPDRGTQTYAYNALGERVSQTSTRNQTAMFGYDRLGRLVRRTEPEGMTVWVYGATRTGQGRLAQVSAPGGYLRTHAYDAYGRPTRETSTIGGERFTSSRTYDSAGRVSTVTYPKSGLVVRREYTATGYLEKVRKDGSCGTAYWTAEAVNAEGQVKESLRGNGVGTTRVFDPRTGLIQSIQSGPGETSEVQDLGYVFDGYGNLASREDFAQEVYESFTYDRLNRLTGSTLQNAETEAVLARKSYRYDAVGNLIHKSDAGASDYGYGADHAGPHAVTSAGGRTYAYDAGGNMVSGAGRALTWTSFQKPRTIAKGSTTSTFGYGAERQRVLQVKVKGSVTERLTSVEGLYERVEKTGSATEHVHYVFAGGMRVAVETASEAAGANVKLRYLHQDHLGSVDVVTDESSSVAERLSFGAFGERRGAQGSTAWLDSALALSSSQTRRGFAGHEQLDDFGLVHMSGRLYDPHLGRFLSADPFVPFARSSQGDNPYAYANNNPLSFIDPGGDPWGGTFGFVGDLVEAVATPFEWAEISPPGTSGEEVQSAP